MLERHEIPNLNASPSSIELAHHEPVSRAIDRGEHRYAIALAGPEEVLGEDVEAQRNAQQSDHELGDPVCARISR